MPKEIVTLPPSSDFEKQSGWRNLGKNLYSAERRVILIVKTRLDDAVDGPALQTASYPAGTKYTFTTKEITAKKHTDTVQRTAELTISTTLSTEFLAKHSLGSGVGVTGPSVTVGQEVSEKIATEVSTAAKEALSVTAAFEIQNTEEITHSAEVTDGATAGDGKPLLLNLYLKLYEWHFDFYLVRLDELTIEYRKRLFGLLNPVRQKVKSASDPKALPLFRLRLYEPINELSLAKGPYRPAIDIDTATSVLVEPLGQLAPAFRIADQPDLEELAAIAFPKTSEERKAASRKARKKAAAPKKKAAKTRALKRASAKKPARKAARRATPRRKK